MAAETVAELVAQRADDPGPGLLTAAAQLHPRRGGGRRRRPGPPGWPSRRVPGPFHVALLLDNVAEHVLWLQAAALAGAVVVGANPTHRGDELARDLTHTECQLLVTSTAHLPLVAGRRLGDALGHGGGGEPPAPRGGRPGGRRGPRPLRRGRGARRRASGIGPDDPRLPALHLGHLGGAQGLPLHPGQAGPDRGDRGPDVRPHRRRRLLSLPCPSSTPTPSWPGGARPWPPAPTVALPTGGRFSASGFLPDVRRFGATYFNYVGKPLAYVLATPERPDDADNPLVRAFGNEGGRDDVERFAARFGCSVTDAYGSTEGGAVVARTPDTPPGALGRAPEGTVVLDPATGAECPPARFDDRGRLLNASEAIGELVSRDGASGFEGYWRNDEAEQARLREGWYWTGDLAYRDEAGLLLLRRPGPRLAAGGRGELRRRPGGADPRAPPRRGAGRRLRRPRRRGRRPGHGRPPAAARGPTVRPRGASPASSPPRGTSAPSGARATCGSATCCRSPPPTRS